MIRLLSRTNILSRALQLVAVAGIIGGLQASPITNSLKPFGPAFAQNAEENNGEENDEAAPAPEPRIRTLPPAYETQMLRLAEVMGALHYLRALCGADEGQLWRIEMQKLLDAEQPSAERRAQLTAHFNRGFRGYAEIYRECTQPASDAANQFLRQGMRLAAEIPNRYGR